MNSRHALPPIVDTHAHLDDEAFEADRADVIAAARSAGVVRIINIGYRPESWRSSLALQDAFPEVRFALGLHPQLADNFNCSLEQDLIRAIAQSRPVAIGETGFDFSRRGPALADQARAFRRQIELALETNLPLIIHQRNASDAVLAELSQWPTVASIVLHSFDGNDCLTDWAIERGCHIGVGGLATRGNSHALRERLSRVPLERILLETDAPYLAPPQAASRRNAPDQLPAIAQIIAPIWNISAEELCWQTTRNATQIFDVGFT